MSESLDSVHISECLEKSHRRAAFWRWMSTTLMVVVGFFTVTAAAAPDSPRDVVRARRFILIGPGGQEMAVLGVGNEGGSFLGLNGPRGKLGAGIMAMPTGGQVSVFDANGRGSAEMLHGVGGGAVLVRDKRSRPVGQLSSGEEGGFVSLNSKKGQEGVQLGAALAGGFLLVNDGAGDLTGYFGLNDKGHSFVALHEVRVCSRTGNLVAVLGSRQEIGSLELRDAKGRPVAKLPARAPQAKADGK